MSRYTQKTQEYIYSWGYDEPLSEYFFHKERRHALVTSEFENEDEDDLTVFCISNYFTLKPHPEKFGKFKFSTGEIIQIMTDEMKVNTELRINPLHIEKMILDLPF